jgi:hypothetical protein
LLLIFADIGIIFFGKKILEKMKLPIHTIFWYALNPFIIIELTWNLHFEPVMLFFLLWSFYTLICQKWGWSAVLLGISVSVKLIPLLFLPLFYQWFTSPLVRNTKASFFQKWRPHFFGMTKLIAFSSVVLGVNIVLFLPFLSSKLISSYTNSVGLWFQNFEFNASFYYLFREIGYLFRGYNEIAIIGKIMPLLTIVFLGFMTFFRKNKTPKELFTALLFGLSFYYFTTTTMHPWYLATLIILAVFTEYRFPIVWSCVIILSYAAYATETYKENIGLLFLEYSVVYGFLIGELYFKKKA